MEHFSKNECLFVMDAMEVTECRAALRLIPRDD
jgi:hypothetical protein